MIGATLLVVNDQDRLLLLIRVDDECWGPPGGAVELGEVVEKAANLETFEETGLKIGGMKLFGIFSGLEQFYRHQSGDEVYNVTIVYLSHNLSGIVRLSSEHKDWHWFMPSEIPEDLRSPIKPVIEQFKQSCV
jgi:ADP-ribose pyrophosphatase YjhB (NUDIX family)